MCSLYNRFPTDSALKGWREGASLWNVVQQRYLTPPKPEWIEPRSFFRTTLSPFYGNSESLLALLCAQTRRICMLTRQLKRHNIKGWIVYSRNGKRSVSKISEAFLKFKSFANSHTISCVHVVPFNRISPLFHQNFKRDLFSTWSRICDDPDIIFSRLEIVVNGCVFLIAAGEEVLLWTDLQEMWTFTCY